MTDKYEIKAIGQVKKTEDATWLQINDEYKDGMLRLEEFSHIITLWWITGRDTKEDRARLQVHPCVKMAEEHLGINTPLCGVFVTRSPARPNPIGLTTVKILKVVENKIFIDRHDAFDDTPIIDIKPYLPRSDCIMNVTLPDFFSMLREKRVE